MLQNLCKDSNDEYNSIWVLSKLKFALAIDTWLNYGAIYRNMPTKITVDDAKTCKREMLYAVSKQNTESVTRIGN